MINLEALAGTILIVLIALAIRSAYRRYRVGRQQTYDRAYAAGVAAGEARQGRLDYARGKEDGLIEGRAQAGRVDLIKYNKAYDEGYTQGQLDLIGAISEADQARGTGPAMSA